MAKFNERQQQMFEAFLAQEQEANQVAPLPTESRAQVEGPQDAPIESAVIPTSRTGLEEQGGGGGWGSQPVQRGQDARNVFPPSAQEGIANDLIQIGNPVDPLRSAENENPLNDGEKRQLNNLIELAQTDPSQRQSAMQQAQVLLDGRNYNPLEMGIGLADAARVVGGSAILDMATGATSALWTSLHAVTGGQFGWSMDESANYINNMRERYGPVPRSITAQDYLGQVGVLAGAVDSGARELSATLGMGNPMASTAIYTSIMGSMDILSASRGASNLNKYANLRTQLRNEADNLRTAAERNGLNLESTDLRYDLERAISRQGNRVREQGFDDLQITLRQLEAAERRHVDDLYNTARDTGTARLYPRRTQNWTGEVLDDMSRYGTQNADGAMTWDHFPILRDRLRELRALGAEVNGVRRNPTVQQLIDIRNKGNLQRPRGESGAAEAGGIARLNNHIDQRLKSEFAGDMIRGDSSAITKWQEAISGAKNYFNTWTDHDILMNLIDRETSVRGAKDMIFNANAVNMGRQTVNAVDQLINVLGADSPQVDALRYAILDDVVKPVYSAADSRAGLRQFINNYDQLTARQSNLQVLDKLGINVERDLKPLRQFAESVNRITPQHVEWPKLTNMASRFLFGHSIARAGMRVRLAQTFFDLMTARGPRGSNAILADVIGRAHKGDATFNIFNEPLIPRDGIAAGTIIHSDALQRLGIEEDDQD